MSQPIIRIRQSGGKGPYLTLTDFDAIGSSITFARPDPYTQDFVGEWPGHRLAIISSANSTLVRFISFFTSWNTADLSLDLVVQAVNLDGTNSGKRVVHKLVEIGDTFTFDSGTEPGLSYMITRMA